MRSCWEVDVKTAAEVLQRIDEEIENMERAAAGPCIDALIEWSDREAYRDAMRKAYGLKAIQSLRQTLAGEIENGAEAPRRRKR